MLSSCGTSLDYTDLDETGSQVQTQDTTITDVETTLEDIPTSIATTTVTETSIPPNSNEIVLSESSVTEPVTTTEATTNILSSYGDEKQLISLATSLHQVACEMAWNYYNGSPYSLNYDTFIEDDYGGIYFLIDDSSIKTLDDVHEDWFEIFSSTTNPKDFDGHFIEKNEKVYVNDGTRGADIYYKNTEITEITSIVGNEVTFKAVSHFVNPEDNSAMDDETYDFSIILEDGSYHVGKFTLPY